MEKYNNKQDFSPIPQSFHNKVVNTLYSLPHKKERKNMTSLFSKKRLIIAVAAMVALVTTAYAVGNIKSFVGFSSSTPEYTSFPTDGQLQKDLGFVPMTLENFENGYKFVNGHISNSEGLDENNNKVVEFKGYFADYMKDGKKISLIAENYINSDKSGQKLIGTAKGIDLYYTGYTSKLVSVNYKLTAEDKAKEANGELVFSYGLDEGAAPIIQEVQSLSFQHNNIQYLILTMGNVLEQSELMQMAAEVIG